jgi:pyruvate dehydrogenase kinase 2/3/4
MRIGRVCFNKIATLINSYSNYNPSPLSLKKFTDFGKAISSNGSNGSKKETSNLKKDVEIKSYEFLREELLVRLALMTKEMLYLPERLIKTPSVQMVYSWYLRSFEEVLTHKEQKIDDKELSRLII